jgi:tRNA (mo5U34)-methyltransferase
MQIDEMCERAKAFQRQIDEQKAEIGPVEFRWYPYDTLGNFEHLNALLTGEHRGLFDRIGERPIADIGGADGQIAFFLESLGYTTELIDYAPTNMNNLKGATRLKEAFHSRVEIHDVDLDAQFTLPHHDYALVIFLGILYHLKNPFYALETLSKCAKYCLVSTRITMLSPDKRVTLQHVPVAYLLDPDESNNDATNYWIFSEAGLRRIFARTGWVVEDYRNVGNTIDSDPASAEGDERTFVLLRSTHVE